MNQQSNLPSPKRRAFLLWGCATATSMALSCTDSHAPSPKALHIGTASDAEGYQSFLTQYQTALLHNPALPPDQRIEAYNKALKQYVESANALYDRAKHINPQQAMMIQDRLCSTGIIYPCDFWEKGSWMRLGECFVEVQQKEGHEAVLRVMTRSGNSFEYMERPAWHHLWMTKDVKMDPRTMPSLDDIMQLYQKPAPESLPVGMIMRDVTYGLTA